jgi:hypothetical protein
MNAYGAVVGAVLLLWTSSGCTRSRIDFGNPVRPNEAATIVEGVPKAVVLAQLGPPDRVDVEPGGSAFEYLYSRSAVRSLDVSLYQSSFSYDEARAKVDRLRVGFDARGLVRYISVIPPGDQTLP